MKDIISSILIIALLIQIVGCYSSRELTIGDLKNINDKEVIKIVANDSTEYLLQNPPESFNRYRWKMDGNNIYIYSNAGKLGNNKQIEPLDSLKLPFYSVENISTDKFDTGKTILLVLGVVVVLSLAFIVAFSIAINNTMKDCSESVGANH